MLCSRCATNLPEDSQFCLKCGEPVGSPPKGTAVDALPRRRPRRFFLVWFLVALLVAAVLWVVGSDSPAAQRVQEFAGWNHDRSIIDESFSVGPHTFRYYKFFSSDGSTNAAVVGQFTSVADSNDLGARKNSGKDPDKDDNIEVYVLPEPAFIVWQNGYAASSLYDSGKVAQGAVQAEIPAGAGIYYLVFSNKAAPKASKTVHATVTLHYKSWSTDWFRRVKDWFGL